MLIPFLLCFGKMMKLGELLSVSQTWVWDEGEEDPRCVPSPLLRLQQGLVAALAGSQGLNDSDLEPIHSLCQSNAKQTNGCSEHLWISAKHAGTAG